MFNDLIKQAEDKIKEAAKQGLEKNFNVESNTVSLDNIVDLTPKFVQDLVKDKELLISESLLSAQIKSNLKDIDGIQSIEAHCSNDGIVINAKYTKTTLVADLNFIININRVELRPDQEIFFSVSKLDVSSEYILQPILLSVAKSCIKAMLKDPLSDIENGSITISKMDDLYVCDVSNVESLYLAHREIQMIQKSAFDILKVLGLIHTDDGVLLKFDISFI